MCKRWVLLSLFTQSWRHIDIRSWEEARQGAAVVGCPPLLPRPLLPRPQPTCHGGTVRRCGGETLPSPCSPLAEKGAPHLRVLQFQSFIWIARLILPFPTGITQARRLFRCTPHALLDLKNTEQPNHTLDCSWTIINLSVSFYGRESC